MVEWHTHFHEAVQIANVFRDLMGENSMAHSEFSATHHELVGRKAECFHKNLVKLFHLVQGKGNPYSAYRQTANVKLQNILNRVLIDESVAKRYLEIVKNGDRLVAELREERFITKKKKLGHTISKRMLPKLGFKKDQPSLLSPTVITSKMVAEAQRKIDIAKERGMTTCKIYSFDHLPASSLFDGKLPKKVPAKVFS